MNTRKIIAIILSLIFAIQLAGCKKEVTQNEVTQEEVTITFAAYDGLHELLKVIAEDYRSEHPEITVEIVSLPDHQAVSESGVSYEEALATNADCTLLNNGVARLDQYFLDLEPIYSTDKNFNPKDYWQNSLKACENEEGSVYCLPHRIFYDGFYFDKDYLELASLPLPDIDWEWDDFYAYIDFLTESDVAGSGQPVYSNNRYSTSLFLQIGENLVENNGQLDVEKLKTDTETFISFIEKDGVSVITDQYAESQSEDPLVWQSALAKEIDRINGDEDPRVATVPIPGAKMPLFVEGFGISAGSNNPMVAWEWLKHLSTYPFSNNEGSTPTSAIYAVKSLAENSNVWEMLTEESQEAVTLSLENMISVYPYKNEHNYVYNSVLEVVRGEKSMEEAISNIEQEMEQSLIEMEESVAAEVIVATPNDNAVVNFHYAGGSRANYWVMQEVIEEYNELYQLDPPVVISDVWPSGPGGFFENVTNEYDCFITSLKLNGAASDLVLDLTPLFSAEDSEFRNDFDAETLELGQYEGKLYRLPFSLQPPVAVYNVDLLIEKGVPLPTNDWTYEEFLETILAATVQSEEKPTYGFLAEGSLGSGDVLWAGNDVVWLDFDGEIPKANYLSEEMTHYAQFMRQMYDQGVFVSPGANGEDWWTSMTAAIENGRVAVWFAAMGDEEGMSSGTKPENYHFDYEIGVVSLPLPQDYGPTLTGTMDKGFYISEQSPYQEVCWNLAKFLTSNVQTYQQAMPVRNSVRTSTEWLNLFSAEEQAAYLSAYEKSHYQISGREQYLIYPYTWWLAEANWSGWTEEYSDPETTFPESQRKADEYYQCLVENNAEKLIGAELEAVVNSCREKAEGK